MKTKMDQRGLMKIMVAIVVLQLFVCLAFMAVTAFVYKTKDTDKASANELTFQHLQMKKANIEHDASLQKRDTDQAAEVAKTRTRKRTGKHPCGKNPFTHVYIEKREAKTNEETHVAPKSNFDLITTTNWDFVDITENWLESLRRLCIQYNITMVCEDKKSYTYFKRRAHSYFHVLSAKQFKMADTLRRGTTFQELILKRIIYVRESVKQNRDVLLADVDAVWIQDPLRFIWESYDQYDVWIASGKFDHLPCPCFMYMKASQKMVKLTESWVERILEDKTKTKEELDNHFVTDQWALKPLLQNGEKKGNLKVKWLEKSYFPTGNLLFDEDWIRENKSLMAIAHANNLGRHDGKKKAFKDLGLWLLSN